MRPELSRIVGSGRILLVTAAPAEARAVMAALGGAGEPGPWTLVAADDRTDVLVTGIGKVNAGAAVARFANPARHMAVLNVGIAGVLPGAGLEIGRSIAATACVYADEGVESSEGFKDCGEMGFPLGDFPGRCVPVNEALLAATRTVTDAAGPIATVSTCSGTDALAARVRERTGGLAEAMEGAAVAHVCRRLGLAGGELRVVSNTTGERSGQRWDLRGSLRALSEVLGRLLR